MSAIVLAAVRPDPPAMPEYADAAFYVVALLSAVATAGALAVMRAMETRASAAPDPDAALAAVRSLGIVALAMAEAPALAAGVAAFLTGDLLTLAFLVPFLAVVALTWPTADRVAHWTGGR
jgi:heme/copper-type cytochrome/quinol oxidase subunit 1